MSNLIYWSIYLFWLIVLTDWLHLTKNYSQNYFEAMFDLYNVWTPPHTPTPTKSGLFLRGWVRGHRSFISLIHPLFYCFWHPGHQKKVRVMIPKPYRFVRRGRFSKWPSLWASKSQNAWKMSSSISNCSLDRTWTYSYLNRLLS